MRKDEKYVISTYLNEGDMSTSIEVSRTKFFKALEDVDEQFKKQEHDSEFYIPVDKRIYEYEKYIEDIIEYKAGISYLTFSHLVCKEGYYFRK